MRIKVLRDQRADLVRENRTILDAAAAGKRLRSDAEKARQEAIRGELMAITEEIAAEEHQLELERTVEPTRGPADHTASQRAALAAGAGDGKGGFSSFGEFLQAVAGATMPNQHVDPRLVWQAPDPKRAAATGLGELIQADGGFLVTKDFSAEILRKTYETGQIMSRVRRVPISGGSNGLKINAIDETSRVDGSRWGGVLSYWTAEAAAFTASQPKFRQMELQLHKITGLVYGTDEVLADAAALESIVNEALPEELMFRCEDAIVNGSGAGQPLGYLNSGAVVTVSAESGQPTGTIVFENVLKMWSRMWARSRQNAVWLINQDCEPQLYQMVLKIGTGGVPVYLPAGGVSGQPYATLFGRPVIPVEYCSTVGTVGDIQLVDLSQYLTIDKGAIQSAVSMHVRFLNDEQVFRFLYRIDGQPVWNAPLTPKNGTNTLSPFVLLASRP